VNARSCNKAGCFRIKKRTDAIKLTNVRIARYRQCKDLIRESEVFIKYEAKVSVEKGLFILASCCLSQTRRNSVLEELRVSRLAVVQKEICCKTSCR